MTSKILELISKCNKENGKIEFLSRHYIECLEYASKDKVSLISKTDCDIFVIESSRIITEEMTPYKPFRSDKYFFIERRN
jgi:hypothetical protein